MLHEQGQGWVHPSAPHPPDLRRAWTPQEALQGHWVLLGLGLTPGPVIQAHVTWHPWRLALSREPRQSGFSPCSVLDIGFWEVGLRAQAPVSGLQLGAAGMSLADLLDTRGGCWEFQLSKTENLSQVQTQTQQMVVSGSRVHGLVDL